MRFLVRRMEYALEVGLAIIIEGIYFFYVIDIVYLLRVLLKPLRRSRRDFLAHVPFLRFLFSLLVL